MPKILGMRNGTGSKGGGDPKADPGAVGRLKSGAESTKGKKMKAKKKGKFPTNLKGLKKKGGGK